VVRVALKDEEHDSVSARKEVTVCIRQDKQAGAAGFYGLRDPGDLHAHCCASRDI
jgi:hypothetical protein